MSRSPLLLLPILGLLYAAACSTTPSWSDGGLTLTLPAGGVVSGHAVSAQLTNNTGSRIQFAPPGCGLLEVETDDGWQVVESTANQSCVTVVMSLDNGKSYPFAFEVPSNTGRYRLVTGAVDAIGQRLTVRSAAVTVP